MTTINEGKIIELKKKAEEAKSKALQAKGTMKEVESQILELEAELRDLGIKDLQNAYEEIEKLTNKVNSLYEEAKNKLNDYIDR